MKSSSLKRTTSRISCSNLPLADPAAGQKTITLIIKKQEKLSQTPEIVADFKCNVNENGNLLVDYFIAECRNRHHIPEDSSVSFYLPHQRIYVFGFLNRNGVRVELREIQHKFLDDNTLTIKVRERKRVTIHELLEEQKLKFEEPDDDKNTKGQKEKKISEVVEKVALWRKFYSGFLDDSGNYVQKQLDVAATDVGIAKKTLDDYLLQIRNGKKYGFNFTEKANCRIGELRSFVRDEKKKESK